MGEQALTGDLNYLSKITRQSFQQQSRKRGRRPTS